MFGRITMVVVFARVAIAYAMVGYISAMLVGYTMAVYTMARIDNGNAWLYLASLAGPPGCFWHKSADEPKPQAEALTVCTLAEPMVNTQRQS